MLGKNFTIQSKKPCQEIQTLPQYGPAAFLYSGGTLTYLSELGGWYTGYTPHYYCIPWGINDSGQIVGYSTTDSGAGHAFLNSGGQKTDLGHLPGTFNYHPESCATGINNSGQIVGYSDIPSGPDGLYHAFLYSGGHMTDLGTLGGTSSQATGINNKGQIIGYSTTASGQTHAFLYNPAYSSLPAIPLLLLESN